MSEWTHRLSQATSWPERRGLRCAIVSRPMDWHGERYPWTGLARHEVVVLVEDDPFPPAHPGWSCVVYRSHLEPL